MAFRTSALLRGAGYEVRLRSTLSGGTRALDWRPDLIIADVKLGAFNGLQLAMRASWTGVPAVVIGGVDRVLKREAQALGATYVGGTIGGDSMLALVESLASLATLRRAGRLEWIERVPEDQRLVLPTPRHMIH